jgi:ABC-2 type transport system permease protein
VLAQNAFNELAGTGLAAHRHFVDQGERFLKSWQDFFFPRIFSRTLLVAKDLERLPRFTYTPENPADVIGRAGGWLLGLAIPLALLVWAASAGLRRYRLAN